MDTIDTVTCRISCQNCACLSSWGRSVADIKGSGHLLMGRALRSLPVSLESLNGSPNLQNIYIGLVGCILSGRSAS